MKDKILKKLIKKYKYLKDYTIEQLQSEFENRGYLGVPLDNGERVLIDGAGNIFAKYDKYDTVIWAKRRGLQKMEQIRQEYLEEKKVKPINYEREEYQAEEVKFDFVGKFQDDGLAVFLRGGKSGFINRNNEIVVELPYERVTPIYEGFCLAYKDDKAVFLDSDFKEVSPYYERAEMFGNCFPNHAAVMINGKWGLVDSNFDLVVPCEYDTIRKGDNGENGLCSAQKDGEWVRIDQNGNEYRTEEEIAEFVKRNSKENIKTISKNSSDKKEFSYSKAKPITKIKESKTKKAESKTKVKSSSASSVKSPEKTKVKTLKLEKNSVNNESKSITNLKNKKEEKVQQPEFVDGIAEIKKDGQVVFVDNEGNEYNAKEAEIMRNGFRQVEEKRACLITKVDDAQSQDEIIKIKQEAKIELDAIRAHAQADVIKERELLKLESEKVNAKDFINKL